MKSKQQQEQELDRLIDSILGFDSAALQRDMADGFDRYRRPENHLVAFYARVACLALFLCFLTTACTPAGPIGDCRTTSGYSEEQALADTLLILERNEKA